MLLSVFHNRRWDSDFLTLKALLNEGRWARWSISSRISIATGRRCASWREQGGVGSGIWFDLGPHLLDQALQLFGKPDRLFVDLGSCGRARRRWTISTRC